MSKSLLIINPNSSKSVTDNLETIVSPIPGFTFEYFTGPPESPKEIDGSETAHQSTEACLPVLKEKYLDRFDGYLVCCYSDHPLIYELRKLVKVPVLGIFQATVLYSLGYCDINNKFAILTSTNSWEKILDDSLKDFFYGTEKVGGESVTATGSWYDYFYSFIFGSSSRSLPLFALPTVAANVDVLELQDPKKFEELKGKVQKLVDEGAKIILLGCAGLSGLDKKFKHVFPGIKFVDSVAVGVELLAAYSRFDSEH
ncbi:isomerase activity protein [[Candida] boidinii]|nr:isomerase activity protein [[Candida] boidinii]OWB74193.1 isomerase activity protein [[Candida] boidinii]OWB79333.1 isomerase activity protein [[Candida] boidinii]